MTMNQNESYADFVVRVMTNLEDYKLTKQEAFKQLFNREMANDNIRKVSYLASYIQEAIDSGYYKKFLGEDVIETPKEIVENETIPIIKQEIEVPIRRYAPKIYKNSNSIKLAVLSGDKHFCYEDKHAIDILEQVCQDYSEFIDEFIDGGDGINNDALSKFVSTEEEQFTLYDEMKAFENHMYKMKDILPNSKFVIVQDNHYHTRVKKFLAENPAMKGLLKDIDFPFDEQVNHGVPYFPFQQRRVGVIHGLRVNDNFTKGHSDLFKEDIINFHTHGSQHYTCKNGSKALNKEAQKMWGMPSMCNQMDYMNGSPSRSNTGFGFLWYDLENNNYNLQYVFIENASTIFNGKIYKSKVGV